MIASKQERALREGPIIGEDMCPPELAVAGYVRGGTDEGDPGTVSPIVILRQEMTSHNIVSTYTNSNHKK